MAQIAYIASSLSFSGDAEIADLFRHHGHDVVMLLTSGLTVEQLQQFDCVFSNVTATSASGPIQGAWNSGVPWLIGPSGGGATAASAGLASSNGNINSSTNNRLLVTGDIGGIFADVGFELGQAVNLRSNISTGITASYLQGNLAGGATKLAVVHDLTDRVVVLLAPRGSPRLSSGTFPARTGFASFLVNVNNFTDAARDMAGAIIGWMVGGKSLIKGFVRDKSGLPLVRNMFAYRRSGALAGSASSSAETGYYEIEGLNDEPHFLVCLDEGTPNAQIFDHVMPVLAE